MTTYRLIVYLCLDEIKVLSDDSNIQEEHILFLADKYRTLLLKQRYSDIKKEIPTSNYQTICIDLQKYASAEPYCGNTCYLRSVDKIPNRIPIGNAIVTPEDYYQGYITLVDKERMRYVGNNKYLKNIIYCSLGADNYLYFKSNNPLFIHLEKVKYTGIFEDTETAAKLSCDNQDNPLCDLLDMNFPLEDSLIPSLVELIVKELLGVAYRPSDTENNAKDDFSDMVSYIRRNMKSGLLKLIEE